MKKIIFYFIFIVLILLNFSCIFSNDDKIQEYQVVGNYLVSCFAGYNSLEYRIPGSNSGTVILMNTDSIGWHDSEILAVYEKEYFLIDTLSQKITAKYKSYKDIVLSRRDLNIASFNLKGLPLNIK